MNNKRNLIAIQGIIGSFHHEVGLNCYGNDSEFVECSSFDEVVEKIIKKKVSRGIMAIENSIVGSIIPNYALIDNYKLNIVREYFLNINHNLLAIKGCEISDLSEVHSHPMAILQCKKFFKKHKNIKLIESDDTAETAKIIAEKQISNIGAIASNSAARLYGLNILSKSIQTIKNNVTRFVIVENHDTKKNKYFDKASLKFILNHQRGSLAHILKTMSDSKLNLTKIQSLPVIEKPGKYSFFVDVTFEDVENYNEACFKLLKSAQEFKILGEYKKA
tara:strand:+ start:58052 stop:58879 length:828 start_codon:yes stop_codon:yes gene_type:complete